VGAAGTERGFGAGSRFKSGTGALRLGQVAPHGDDTAIAHARIVRAYESLLSAALAWLRLHYAARLSGLLLVARGDASAAVAALLSERDTALEQLRQAILDDRRAAMLAARRPRRARRAALPKAGCPSRPARPSRPTTRCPDHSP
jgi:hypothetical protein